MSDESNVRSELSRSRSASEPTCDCKTLRARLAELRKERLEIASLFGIVPCYDDTPHTWADGPKGNVSLVSLLESYAADSRSGPVPNTGTALSEEERQRVMEIRARLLAASVWGYQWGVQQQAQADLTFSLAIIDRLSSAPSRGSDSGEEQAR